MKVTAPAGMVRGGGASRFRATLRYLVTLAIVALLYILTARWGLSFWIVQHNVTLVWPPAGIALAAVLILGYRVLPAIAVGAFVATASTGAPPLLAAATAIGNPLEALVAAALLRRIAGLDHQLQRVRDAISLVALGALPSTTLAATIGAASLCLLGMAQWSAFGALWLSWWLGDALGIVLVSPVALCWASRGALRWQPVRAIEACAYFILLALATQFVFGMPLSRGADHMLLAYVPFPLLIWAAFRYGPRGATAATLIVSAIAVAGVAQGHGPFGPFSLQDRLWVLLIFVSVFSLTALILAAALAERNQANRSLQRAHDELERQVQERTAALEQLNAELSADIAERQRVQEELQSLSRFPSENPSPVLRIARDGTILYANGASALLLAAWGRRVGEFAPDEWRARITAACESQTGGEFEIVSSDRVFSCILTPIAGAAYANVYGRDVTEHHRMNAARERLATAVEQAAEAVVITDVNGQIEYVNPAFERITGYSREEAIGKNTRFLKSGQHDDAFYRQLWETITRGDTWIGRIINRRKDGTLYHEDVTISPVRDGNGQIVNYVGIKRDISREVILETQLRESQTLEAVGQLAGGVAHEFNNLLTAILGGSEIIAASLAADHPARAHARRIKLSTDRAAELVHQLLAFGRKQIVQSRVLNLNAVVHDALKLLRPLLGEHIQIETRLAPELGSVRADHGQIVQLITNLSVNARDAMPQGGTLTIATTNVRVDETDSDGTESITPGRHVMLSVEDTGCGMDAQTRAHLFEPFFTTKDVGQGTGMGLATVYGIVHQHGGRIVVDSQPGQGTTFHVYLPCAADGLGPSRGPTEAAHSRARTAIVLLVEDEEEVREVACDILRAEGHTVLTAEHGAAALRVCARHEGRLDLLVTDVVMPRMGGPELAQQLLRLHPETKVLYTSGYAPAFLSTQGQLRPNTAFLAKPFTRRALAAKVREMLSSPPPRRTRPSGTPVSESPC